MEKKQAIFYYSTMRGVAGDSMLYYGKTYRVPNVDITNQARAGKHIETELNELYEFISMIPDNLEMGGIIERYEVFEPESDDILIMWRVPLREKAGQDSAKAKPVM